MQLAAFQEDFDRAQIKQQLSCMVAADQFLRAKINHSHLDQDLLKEIREKDQEHLEKLKVIINNHYWITFSEFGEEADHHAWLVAQHADCDIEFQKEILDKLEKLYPLKETCTKKFVFR